MSLASDVDLQNTWHALLHMAIDAIRKKTRAGFVSLFLNIIREEFRNADNKCVVRMLILP